ncbi:MAG: S-methyl-5-thioribose-1-phosphate isomerase [Candidatus Aminicenantaceae bacterium]
MHPTIEWKDNKVIMIDQRKLPGEEIYVKCRDYDEVAEAIENMVIRGAPAIGVAAAYGVALGFKNIKKGKNLTKEFDHIYRRLEKTRPTAVNLFWALERMRNVYNDNNNLPLRQLKERLLEEAHLIEKEDIEKNKNIGVHGKILIKDGDSILTHCNAGALATAGYGTALGVVRAAKEEGKKVCVYADETRPFLQGARLTCWELKKDDIPVVLITDNMAGCLMQKGIISMVITGADRIAANGDAANKIGTYSLAVLAKEHKLPFYIAAPLSTVDFDIDNGTKIPIEERDAREVREFGGKCVTVEDVRVCNPAFDVTPAQYITGIITEKAVVYPPYFENLSKLR